MCGIAGFQGNFDAGLLARMSEAIAHRGPDGCGAFHRPEHGIGLAHRRLAIIDLSHDADQPMCDDASGLAIVFNGEIYNYRELRAELVHDGYAFRTQSDTEVLLRLYARDGEAMLTRLNGIFAFAIWDAGKRELFLARDGLGVKPLYYAQTPQGFLFASEIKALLHLMPEARELDPEAIHRYLTFLWCPGEGTPLKQVRKLLPGEAMVVRAGQIERRWIWYQLPVFQGGAEALDEAQSVEGTAHHLRQAVYRQMVSDVPLGAFLSGGLDSSAVVAFAREQNPDIRCFTIEVIGGQEAGAIDDLPYARRVAKHLGVSLDVVSIDAGRMAGDLERMVAQLDEPLADPAPLNVLYISQLAREHGIKVLLSGAGGDDLFTGYRRHRAVRLERCWSWLPEGIRRGLGHAMVGLDQRRAWSRRVTRLFDGAGLDGDARLVHYFRWISESRLQALYTPAFRARLGDAEAIAPMLEFLRLLSARAEPLERMLALEQRFFLADHNLIYTDKMSMAVGVEVRVPFLDIDLVNFAARVPVTYKQRGPVGKWVLKKAMEPYLPHDVIYRHKSGFGAPLRRWMRHDLRELLGDVLSAESLKRRGLFEPVAVQRLIAANDAGRVDASYTLLSLLCIEIWCRTFLDAWPSVTVQ